jgi:hypothetical protein
VHELVKGLVEQDRAGAVRVALVGDEQGLDGLDELPVGVLTTRKPAPNSRYSDSVPKISTRKRGSATLGPGCVCAFFPRGDLGCGAGGGPISSENPAAYSRYTVSSIWPYS